MFCKVCHREIEQKARGRKHRTCGANCRQRLRRERIRKEAARRARKRSRPERVWLTCPVCGKRRKVKARGRATATVCSEACAQKKQRKRRIEQAALARAQEALGGQYAQQIRQAADSGARIALCRVCGLPFAAAKWRKNATPYCSKACWQARQRQCPVCGEWFDISDRLGRPRRKTCSARCRGKAGNWAKLDRKGAPVRDGTWHYGLGRGAPRTVEITETWKP